MLRTLGVGGRRSTAVQVAADLDAALMVTAAALRRVGARITRYEADAGALEARVAGALVTVRATGGAGSEITRIDVSTDARRGRRLLRRFRRELTQPAPTTKAPVRAGAE